MGMENQSEAVFFAETIKSPERMGSTAGVDHGSAYLLLLQGEWGGHAVPGNLVKDRGE